MFATFHLAQTMNFLPQISPGQSRLHVLVVDDDEAARSACIEVASSLVYEAGGISRLDRVRSTLLQFPTDIILIDLPKNSDAGLKPSPRSMRFILGSPSLPWRPSTPQV